jgi:PAS domain S-box-containing protein
MFRPSSVPAEPQASQRRFWQGTSRLWRSSPAPPAHESRRGQPNNSQPKPNSAGNPDVSTPERQLKESEFRLRAIAKAVPAILFSAPQDGAVEFFNDYLSKFAGLLAENVTRMDLISLIHPDDRRRVATTSVRAARDYESFSVECRLRAASGDYRWFLVRVSPIQGEGELRWFGIATDIDDVKRLTTGLSDAHRNLESILGSISDCYIALDRGSRIIALNDQAEQWLGKSTDSLIGVDYRTLGDMVSLVSDSARDNLSAGRSFNVAVQDAIYRGISFHEELPSFLFGGRWVDIQINPSKDGAVILFRDVTDRRLDQQRLKRSLGLIQSSLDALTARIAILDADGFIIAVNKAWRSFHPSGGVGDTQMELGTNYLENCEIPALRDRLLNITADGASNFKLPYKLDSSAGPRWYQATVATFRQSEFVRIVVAHEDVTEAVESRESIAELHTRLISLQEEERQRIASELHDSTAQYLVAASLNMARLKNCVGASDGAEKLCDDIDGLLDEALKELRTFTYLLYPTGLSSDGLKITLEHFVAGFEERSSLQVMLSVTEEIDDLPLDFQRTVLRITQEALANAHRHAAATRVNITIGVREGKVRLEVSDDGRGMLHASTSEVTGNIELGVGIAGMKARVAQFGGTIDFPNSANGTTVVAILPIPSCSEPGNAARNGANQESGKNGSVRKYLSNGNWHSPRANELSSGIDRMQLNGGGRNHPIEYQPNDLETVATAANHASPKLH